MSSRITCKDNFKEKMEDKDKPSTSNENEKVKSTAIVKYSVPKPAHFIRLQCNTDLNLPPSNWLSSSADSYGLQQVLCHPKGFSSFRMAHMFPDCIGEVDVVSDAENIKNLLKIPYHKGHISMMVHRVGNTLLVDDFDIYKHLLRTAESEWEWLRKFFYENINPETYKEDKLTYINNRRREALKQKSLVSKFLYHSLAEGEQGEGYITADKPANLPLHGPLLPEPSPSAEVPSSSSSSSSASFGHQFNRNIIWTFEDIQMLLGTDLPIFGGGEYPCISLRLRDMNKPINVLTGIDYWLDNLMSNVPEVVMCYHLNGIVQKYELVKTEDLPRLDGSKFSPKLIRDVAQSILSFLKSNATKAGHTYWLFKGKDEEVVKLYDLTSLCSEEDVENGQNPFTIPVAMLLYRVARNMKHSPEGHQPGTIRMLLKNCVKLLPEEKYPEIVTSSHYMLSDLFIPAETNPESPNLDQSESDDSESVYDDDDFSENDKDSATKILVLDPAYKSATLKNNSKIPPPISGGIEERCLQALLHITSGLNCLKYFPKESCREKEPKLQEEEMKMAKPHEPIPMPYSKISEQTNDKTGQHQKKSSKKHRDKKKKNGKEKEEKAIAETKAGALLPKSKNEAQPLPTWQNNQNMNNISWKDHLKTLLYEKAVLVYAILSEYYYVSGSYGSSLRTIGLLARCQQVMNKLLYSSNSLRENCLLGRAGDCCLMIVQNWTKADAYREQYKNHSNDLKMLQQLEHDEQFYNIQIGQSNIKCVFLYVIRTTEQILHKAVECYVEALKISETDSVLRRMGNCLNEVASYYLNKARSSKDKKSVIEFCKKAEEYLMKGLEVFEKVKDEANIALLYTNTGHLHRLLAHSSTPSDRGELTPQEKLHYNKAFINYKKALQVLGERRHNPGIWDTVNWELSTALYTMGCILHENPPSNVSKSEAEKEVIEILQKALQYCDLDEENPKYLVYQYRAAVIHYRIGSLYHNHIWTGSADSTNRRNVIQLTKINYEKASKLYLMSGDAINYLRSQMQRFALAEFLAETTSALSGKIKHYQSSLTVILEIIDVLQQLIDKTIELPEEEVKCKKDDDQNLSFNNCNSLLNLVRRRLQCMLKNLIKLCLSKPPPIKDAPKLSELYKKCYRITFDLKDNMEYTDLLSILHSVLERIKVEIEEYNKNNL